MVHEIFLRQQSFLEAVSLLMVQGVLGSVHKRRLKASTEKKLREVYLEYMKWVDFGVKIQNYLIALF